MSKLLAQLNQRRVEKIPAGWLSKEQIAKREGYDYTAGACHTLITSAIDAGLLEARKFRVLKRGRIIRVTFYRYVKTK